MSGFGMCFLFLICVCVLLPKGYMMRNYCLTPLWPNIGICNIYRFCSDLMGFRFHLSLRANMIIYDHSTYKLFLLFFILFAINCRTNRSLRSYLRERSIHIMILFFIADRIKMDLLFCTIFVICHIINPVNC